MLRLFDTSTKRDIKELSQKWRLIPDFDNMGDEKGYANGLPEEARYTFVPSCWNFELDLFHHYGTTWYETEFETKEEEELSEETPGDTEGQEGTKEEEEKDEENA